MNAVTALSPTRLSRATADRLLGPVLVDWRANAGDRRVQLALALFRAARLLRTSGQPLPRLLGRVVSAVYMVVVRWTWGIDLPWTTTIGPRLRVFHGTGLVVNSGAVLGADVAVRHGVTIGARRDGGPCPVLGDGVDVGAGAMVLGGVHVGDGAVVGAGAVVLADVPAGRTVVGNPGRLLSSGGTASVRHHGDELGVDGESETVAGS